jgi:integrase/recombinase XerC
MTGLVSWTIEVQGLKAEAYLDTRGVGRTGYRRLLEELDKRTDAKGVRDRAILRLMYELALRRIEIARLDLEDVDLAGATLQVLARNMVLKALGVRSLDQLSGGLRMTAIAALDGKL